MVDDILDDAVVDDKVVDDKVVDDKVVDDKVVDNDVDDVADKTDTGDLLSDDGATDKEGVPDQYTFEPPEGVTIDDATQARLDLFSETAREMGLSQAQYQSLVEYDTDRTQQANEVAVGEWNTRVDGWKADARSDKEVGGEQFAESIKFSKAALKQFGDDDLSALLKSPSPENPNGLAISNNPAILRLLTRVGKVLADPKLLEGDVVAESKDGLQRMYPSMFND